MSARLELCIPSPGTAWSAMQVNAMRPCLEKMSAHERVSWALQYLPGTHLLSSSFGAQSAVMLHLLNTVKPGIPVVLVDTGYLFDETYRFIDELKSRLELNLFVYTPRPGASWLAARHGKLWELGAAEIRRYNQLHKVEPMERALKELKAGTWFSGLRRSQSRSRQDRAVIHVAEGIARMHPIIDWDNRQVHRYLREHALPYHPLWEKGYVSIGDWHTSRPLGHGMSEEQTRFHGLLRECGLHELPARVDGRLGPGPATG